MRSGEWHEITALPRRRSWYQRCSTSCAMRFLGALLVFAACHADGGMSPGVDASPDGPPVDTDGPPSALGLWITWRADPALPGDVDGKLTVTDATFQMDRLQVLGD